MANGADASERGVPRRLRPAWPSGVGVMLPSIALVLASLPPQVPSPDAAAEASASLHARHEAIRAREAEALEAEASRLDAAGQADVARRVRDRIAPPIPRNGPIRFVPLPEHVPPGGDGPAGRPPLPEAAESIRGEAADAYFELAGQAADPAVGRYSLADACLRETIARRPDHREARRLLGYVPHEGGWATADAAAQLKAGKVLHPTFGWVPEDWVEHLDRGELPGTRIANGRPTEWLPAEKADALRADFNRRPWQITTPHFKILTNVPFAEAISFGRRLEDIHDLFFSLMADVIGRERLPLARRLANPRLQPTATRADERHEVWYFAEKSEYVAQLGRLVPRADVGKELGRYLPAMQAGGRKVPSRSYFYRDPGGQIEATATLAHEVSHQLLFESAGRSNYERNAGNYWVWEALGTYFETVEPQPDGSLLVGGLVGPRVGVARALILDGNLYVPIGTLTALGKEAFDDATPVFTEPREVIGPQGIGRVYLHYNESMALAVFLMHYERGRYREGFLDYVRDAYAGRVNTGARSLASYLGVAPERLDREFLAFLKEGREGGVP